MLLIILDRDNISVSKTHRPWHNSWVDFGAKVCIQIYGPRQMLQSYHYHLIQWISLENNINDASKFLLLSVVLNADNIVISNTRRSPM